MPDAAPQPIYRKDYTPPHYRIETVELVEKRGGKSGTWRAERADPDC